jgi:RNA polymerase-binding protein DksA
MKKEQLHALKDMILAKRESLVKSMTRDRDSSDGDTDDSYERHAFHMADAGTDTMNREQQYFFAAREGVSMKALDDALERIEAGDYGMCEWCGEDIPFERLEAVPDAKLCVPCASQNERRR